MAKMKMRDKHVHRHETKAKVVWGAAMCVVWGIDPSSPLTPVLIKSLSDVCGFDPERRITEREAEAMMGEVCGFLQDMSSPRMPLHPNVGLVM